MTRKRGKGAEAWRGKKIGKTLSCKDGENSNEGDGMEKENKEKCKRKKDIGRKKRKNKKGEEVSAD